MLLIRNRQENAIIHGNRASEERGCVCARDGDVSCITAQNGGGGFCSRCCRIAWLKRNPRRLRRAVRGAEAGVTDEHLAVAAVAAARGRLNLSGYLIRGMARSDSQKRDKASRGADRRQNAFRSDQRSVRIGGDEMRGWLARVSRSCASIKQIDLPSRRRIFHEIRGRRAKSDVATIGAHGRRVAFVICRS